jgi:excisionase family DNA binding protein
MASIDPRDLEPAQERPRGGARIIEFQQRPGQELAVTIGELADVLGMSERWIAYRVAKDGMPSHVYGRARRFRVSEVEAYLEGRAR